MRIIIDTSPHGKGLEFTIIFIAWFTRHKLELVDPIMVSEVKKRIVNDLIGTPDGRGIRASGLVDPVLSIGVLEFGIGGKGINTDGHRAGCTIAGFGGITEGLISTGHLVSLAPRTPTAIDIGIGSHGRIYDRTMSKAKREEKK